MPAQTFALSLCCLSTRRPPAEDLVAYAKLHLVMTTFAAEADGELTFSAYPAEGPTGGQQVRKLLVLSRNELFPPASVFFSICSLGRQAHVCLKLCHDG